MKILILMLIIVSIMILDTSIIKTYDLVSKKGTLDWKISIYGLIVLISAIGQCIMLALVKQKRVSAKLSPKQLNLGNMHKLVTGVQFVLISLLVFMTFEIFINSRYSMLILTAITSISYLLGIFMMILLAQRFFSWYKSNKNSIIIVYGLAALAIAANAAFTLLYAVDDFISYPADILPRISGSGLGMQTLWDITLSHGYFVSSLISFLIMWVATSILLRHYSQRLGRVKYWIILSIPLAYFLSQFVTFLLNIFGPLIQEDPALISLVVTLVFTMSKPVGGILFGIVFWIMSKNIGKENIVRNYLTIAACGLVLLFSSNQAIVLTVAPYPPFGLATVSFVGLSCYFILVGIYSSAISVSLDISLRKSIRQSVQEHSKFLHGIGSAQMDRGIQESVLKISKNYSHRVVEEAGIESSFTEDDMKKYVNDVLKEIKAARDNI